MKSLKKYLKLFGAICVATLNEQKVDTGARATFLIIAQRLVGGGRGVWLVDAV